MSELGDPAFDKLDINGDGQVTAKEYKQSLQNNRSVTLEKAEEYVSGYDYNKDGTLSFIEYASGGETGTVDCFGLLSQDSSACKCKEYTCDYPEEDPVEEDPIDTMVSGGASRVERA